VQQPTPLLLHPAVLLKRYKRFLADVRLADGSELTIHCPNTGSMKNCVLPGSPCWYSISDSKARKYPQTLELVTVPGGYLAGINTARTNALVAQALITGVIESLRGYQTLRREVTYGSEKSRIDFLLSDRRVAAGSGEDERLCYLEVKNVTLMETDGAGYFPDAVSERGSKHLRELMAMRAQGHRAVLLFCVQHTGIQTVRAAAHIDPVYATTLAAAQAVGVEIIACAADIVPEQNLIVVTRTLPVLV
jgi:sugar fermentation stimulation protein A